MSEKFAGKTALVTGASSGIGRAAAMAFAAHGASVMCVGTRETALREVVDQIIAAGGKAAFTTADVGDAAAVAAAVDATVAEFGALDIAFNNAGVFPSPAVVADLDEATWNTAINTNLSGVFHCLKHEIRYMREHGGGVIVNTSSNIGAHGRRPRMAAYAASKAAVSNLTSIAALDHIADGIRINAVSPGATATEMSRRPGESDADRAERLKGVVPIGRVAEVQEIVDVVLWLCSEESSFVVGQDVVADGGVTA